MAINRIDFSIWSATTVRAATGAARRCTRWERQDRPVQTVKKTDSARGETMCSQQRRVDKYFLKKIGGIQEVLNIGIKATTCNRTLAAC
jgi:hypothetical protein